LRGDGSDFAFVVILSNTIDQMMALNSAELSVQMKFGDEKELAENEKILEELRKKPIDLLKFYVVTVRLRLFEEQKNGGWKVTEVK
jgi:hypothetical protein